MEMILKNLQNFSLKELMIKKDTETFKKQFLTEKLGKAETLKDTK